MPGMWDVPKDVRTAHLGEFTAAHAAAIAESLDAEQIVWWSKEPGFLSGIWQHGVELFVDKARMQDAQRIAARVLGEG